MEDLKKTYIIKGVGTPQYYLGGDEVELDEQWNREGIYTAFSAKTYIDNCLEKMAQMLNLQQFPYQKSPMDKNYYPELDETKLCSPQDITKYKSLLGSTNWITTLRCFDIMYMVNTLAWYSHAPRHGHLKALQ